LGFEAFRDLFQELLGQVLKVAVPVRANCGVDFVAESLPMVGFWQEQSAG
jgi:hypothetical protein